MDEQTPSDYQFHDKICTELTQTEQRSLIFHLLYVLYAYDYEVSVESVSDDFKRSFGITIPVDSHVFCVVRDIVDQRSSLDEMMLPLLENWRLDRLGVATTLILRLALWELQHGELEPAIVINEAVELAKCFAEKDAYKFINGVLDNYLKQSELVS